MNCLLCKGTGEIPLGDTQRQYCPICNKKGVDFEEDKQTDQVPTKDEGKG